MRISCSARSSARPAGRKPASFALLALATVLATGCGNRLDEHGARAAIEKWAAGNVAKTIGQRDSMQPPACLESLVREGYVRQSGPNSLFYVPTGKLAAVAGATPEKNPDVHLLPLLKTQVVSVGKVVQIPGEETAEVPFTYRLLPGAPGVDLACARGGLDLAGTAFFVLTDKGWVARIQVAPQ